ncbi:hypothetical protein [Bacterioplanoides pacificum]|uniref:Peptidase C-terminal archaeal/bacterial domain-containing protein n=1 Tax=Bacterioplanoides pacificum TaxID=1171596 RepID=A0ABV7VQJ4_9GAMM
MARFTFDPARGLLLSTILCLSACQFDNTADTTQRRSLVEQSNSELTAGESIHGELTTQSPLNAKDGSHYQSHRIELESGHIISLAAEGSFTAQLSLYNDQNTLLASDSPLRFRIDNSGQYAVVVSGASADSYGPYTLSSSTTALAEVGLQIPGTTAGWLQPGVARSYILMLDRDSAYKIDVTSEDFDPVLTISDSQGYYSENDDVGEQDVSASISNLFSRGEYDLMVSAHQGASGMYHVTISPLELTTPGSRILTPGSEITSWISRTTPADSYSLEIKEAGSYLLDMKSIAIDPLLRIDGPDGFHYEDDDSGDGYNARIIRSLEPGQYQVQAGKTEGEDPASNEGLYTLVIHRLRP